MTSIAFLVEQTAPGLYILIGLAVLWSLRRVSLENRSLRGTQFELERDLARFRRANALTQAVLFFEVGLIVLGVQLMVTPTLRATMDISAVIVQNVTDLPFNTPTPAPLAQVSIDDSGIEIEATDPSSIIRVTPIPTNTPPGTIEANAPEAVGCTSDNANLIEPVNGMVVHQLTQVIGTAFVENFARYKLEISGPATGNRYATIQDVVQPVTETGTLSQFNPLGYQEGWYLFRLAVFDQFNTMRASCAVNIFITAPIPTETPIPLN